MESRKSSPGPCRKEAAPAQRFQWSVLAVITEGITLKLEKKGRKLNKTNLCLFSIISRKKESECSKSHNSQTVLVPLHYHYFLWHRRNLSVGAMRKEKLCLSKRLCSSQNLFCTQISCKTEAEQAVLNQLSRAMCDLGSRQAGNLSRLNYGHWNKNRLSWHK